MSDPFLSALPPALRTRRDVLEERGRWASGRVVASSAHAVVVALGAPALVWALGDDRDLAVLVPQALATLGPGVRWVTAPRAVQVPDDALRAAGLERRTSWDRMTLEVPPPHQPGEDDVVAVDVTADADAVVACLALANPRTHAAPGGPDDVAWWAVRAADDGFDGVIGVERRSTLPPAAPDGPGGHAVFLHGLGVVPHARGRGLGAALTAVAARRAFEAGAPSVGLGMYADNAPARRVYDGLGFTVLSANAGYGPPGADRP